MTISLTIYLPDKVFTVEQSDKVILPYDKGNLTVINDRAPTVLLLSSGLVQCLDEKNEIKKMWYVNGGLADIANNVCYVATERIIDLQAETKEQLIEKAKENKFYQNALERLKAFK